MGTETLLNFDRTVIVTGAGAHKPYGLPTSAELTDLILSLSSDADDLHTITGPRYPSLSLKSMTDDKLKICKLILDLKLIKVRANEAQSEHELRVIDSLERFLESFAGAQVDSVDTYLERRTKEGPKATTDVEIGKLLITYFISQKEMGARIGFQKRDWIQYLTQTLLRHAQISELFFRAPPKIITFNYDNYLEKSLYRHLVDFHMTEPEVAKSKVDSLRIKHVYGDIASFGAEDLESPFYRASIERIKVIGEERNALQGVGSKFGVLGDLRNFDHVYFLGFGFDALNTAQLFGPADRGRNSEVNYVSTRINMTAFELSQIANRLPANVHVDFGNDNERNCVKLIREVAPIFESPRSSSDEDMTFMDNDDGDEGSGIW